MPYMRLLLWNPDAAQALLGLSHFPKVDRDDDKADLGDSNYDEFSGYSGLVAKITASEVWAPGLSSEAASAFFWWLRS